MSFCKLIIALHPRLLQPHRDNYNPRKKSQSSNESNYWDGPVPSREGLAPNSVQIWPTSGAAETIETVQLNQSRPGVGRVTERKRERSFHLCCFGKLSHVPREIPLCWTAQSSRNGPLRKKPTKQRIRQRGWWNSVPAVFILFSQKKIS